MSIRPTVRSALLLALSTVPAGCVPPAVNSDRDETIPIPHGASWAWAAPDTSARWERDPALGNEIAHQRYARAIEATMQAKGFHKVDEAGQADFLLTYHMGSRHQGHGRSSGVAMVGLSAGGVWGRGRPGYGGFGYDDGWPGWGWGLYGPPMFGGVGFGGPGAVPYRDGALFVLLRQRESGNVAWEARYALDPYQKQKVSQRRVQEIVDKVFADLQ